MVVSGGDWALSLTSSCEMSALITVIIFGIMDWNRGCETRDRRRITGRELTHLAMYSLTDSSDPTYSTIDVSALKCKMPCSCFK